MPRLAGLQPKVGVHLVHRHGQCLFQLGLEGLLLQTLQQFAHLGQLRVALAFKRIDLVDRLRAPKLIDQRQGAVVELGHRTDRLQCRHRVVDDATLQPDHLVEAEPGRGRHRRCQQRAHGQHKPDLADQAQPAVEPLDPGEHHFQSNVRVPTKVICLAILTGKPAYSPRA